MPTLPLPDVPDWDQPRTDNIQPGAGIPPPPGTPTGDEGWYNNQMTQPQGGGFNLSDFLQGLFGSSGLTGLLTGGLTGLQMHNQADKYFDLGREAAGMASPVSPETRAYYQDRLRRMQEDPAAYLESNPEFMASKKLGLDALFAKNNARGLGGSGAATTDQLQYLSDLSSRFLSQERKDLMHAGGFQFDPANASRYLMEGGKLGLDADKAALAAALYPLGRGGGGQGPGGGGSDPIGSILRMITGGGGGGSAIELITQMARQGMPEAINLLRTLASGPLQRIELPTMPSDRMVENPFAGMLNDQPMDGFDWDSFFNDFNLDPSEFWDTGFGSGQTLEDISSFFDF